MIKKLSFLILLLSSNLCTGQTPPNAYRQLILKADSLYRINEFRATAMVYSSAFQLWDQKAIHHYNAATCWTKVGELDSAFVHLQRMAALDYTDYRFLKSDADLNQLESDPRWTLVLQSIQKNEERIEKMYNYTLIAMLDTGFFEDQRYRKHLDSIKTFFGSTSFEMQQLRRNIRFNQFDES